jgi:hypothetical protein
LGIKSGIKLGIKFPALLHRENFVARRADLTNPPYTLGKPSVSAVTILGDTVFCGGFFVAANELSWRFLYSKLLRQVICDNKL